MLTEDVELIDRFFGKVEVPDYAVNALERIKDAVEKIDSTQQPINKFLKSDQQNTNVDEKTPDNNESLAIALMDRLEKYCNELSPLAADDTLIEIYNEWRSAKADVS